MNDFKTAPERLAHAHKLSEWKHQTALEGVLLTDPSDIVRHEAAFLLGEMKKDGRLTDVPQALKAFSTSSGDGSILVRHEVALALAHFRSEEAISVLIHLAKDSAPEVASSVRYALAAMICEWPIE